MNAAQWQWPDGARLAVSIVVNVEEGSEYTLADGDGMTERSTNWQ